MSSAVGLKMTEIKVDEEYMMTGSNIRAITYWGLWPSKVKNYPILNKLHRVYNCFNLLLFGTFYTSMVIQLFFVFKDILQLMYNLSILLLYTIIMAKISLVLFQREKVTSLFERTREFQEKLMSEKNEKNKQIFMRYVYITRLVSKSFWIMVGSTCVTLVTPGFLALFDINVKVEADGTLTKALPFSCWLIFDQQKYHVTAYFIQVLICVPGTAYVAIWDTFGFSLMMHAICQIKVLQNTLICLKEEGETSVYQSAVKCVELHQEIIRYVADLDSLITNVMFFDFVVYAILLCSIGFRAMFDTDIDFINIISSITYLGGVLVQLFMFYWTGNLLMHESVEIATAAWKSNWYLYDKPVAKLLILLMMRSQKPLRISVGRFYDMNLESLMVILRAWYSYLTLLNQMRED